jgi:hypothetical protein
LCSGCIEDKSKLGESKGDGKRNQPQGLFQSSNEIKREADRVLNPHLPGPLRGIVTSNISSRAVVLAGYGPVGASPNKTDYLPHVEMFDENRGEWRRLRTCVFSLLG